MRVLRTCACLFFSVFFNDWCLTASLTGCRLLERASRAVDENDRAAWRIQTCFDCIFTASVEGARWLLRGIHCIRGVMAVIFDYGRPADVLCLVLLLACLVAFLKHWDEGIAARLPHDV